MYKHKETPDADLHKVFEDFSMLITEARNDSLFKDITELELFGVVDSMARGKTPGHDGIPMEFFQYAWPALGNDLYWMIRKNINKRQFHEEVTKGLLSLIPKEGDNKYLNY